MWFVGLSPLILSVPVTSFNERLILFRPRAELGRYLLFEGPVWGMRPEQESCPGRTHTSCAWRIDSICLVRGQFAGILAVFSFHFGEAGFGRNIFDVQWAGRQIQCMP